jgi:hypothetical protein
LAGDIATAFMDAVLNLPRVKALLQTNISRSTAR